MGFFLHNWSVRQTFKYDIKHAKQQQNPVRRKEKKEFKIKNKKFTEPRKKFQICKFTTRHSTNYNMVLCTLRFKDDVF